MTTSMDVWFGGNKELIWDKFCGYLHFSLPTFMHIQETLLMEQIKLLQGCELGRKVLGNQKINSIEEFRQKAPLTTYADYEHYLSRKMENVLPAKIRTWFMTTYSGGQQRWVPVSQKAWDVLLDSLLGLYIISTASGEAKFSLRPGDVMFNIAPPRPFFAGIGIRDMSPLMGLKLIPPDNDEFNSLEFSERVTRGFHLAQKTGIDLMVALGSMIVTAGQLFKMPDITPKNFLNPKLTKNLMHAWFSHELGKNGVVPGCFWKLKGILATGSDLPVYIPKIEHFWQIKPFEFYINTEYTCYIGCFAWNRKYMTFSPYAGFLEFLPKEEAKKLSDDNNYQPKLVLLNEVKTEQFYELVFTNLNGGIFTRYRTGDIIKFVASGDDVAKISLPQFLVKGRADKLINIGNFVLIDEKTIWQALENSGIKYKNWIARKEVESGQPVLALYLEDGMYDDREQQAISDLMQDKIEEIDPSFGCLKDLAGYNPVKVKVLSSGTFSRWETEVLKSGRDLNWLRDQRMQAPDEVVESILKLTK